MTYADIALHCCSIIRCIQVCNFYCKLFYNVCLVASEGDLPWRCLDDMFLCVKMWGCQVGISLFLKGGRLKGNNFFLQSCCRFISCCTCTWGWQLRHWKINLSGSSLLFYLHVHVLFCFDCFLLPMEDLVIGKHVLKILPVLLLNRHARLKKIEPMQNLSQCNGNK